MAELGHYLALSAALFGIGAIGFLVRRSVLIQLISLELMLGSANLLLVTFNRFRPSDHAGQAFAFLVIVLAVAEAGVGLAIVFSLFRLKRTVHGDQADILKH